MDERDVSDRHVRLFASSQERFKERTMSIIAPPPTVHEASDLETPCQSCPLSAVLAVMGFARVVRSSSPLVCGKKT